MRSPVTQMWHDTSASKSRNRSDCWRRVIVFQRAASSYIFFFLFYSLCLRIRKEEQSLREQSQFASSIRSAYMCDHMDISTLSGVLYVLNSERITYRTATVGFYALIAGALFASDARHFAAFPHVRQRILPSLRLLDSTLVVWICRRSGAEGTMPRSCPRLFIKLGHGSKILPTAAPWDNKGLSAGSLAQTLPWQHYLAYMCAHLSGEC